ncbi:hypothetical protein [Microbispora bryophytorum]|uniref:hypothetical protein n=1 Tax=Microbispora bryophytorum TaxID=1460882 RepID=UPI00371CA4A4
MSEHHGTSPASLIAVDTSAAASLIVVWRTGTNAQGRVVKAGENVVETLRGYAAQTVEAINHGTGRPYDPDDEQEPECTYLTADTEELLDTAVIERIREGGSLAHASEEELRKRPLALYALLVGSDPGRRVAFVRRTNPVSLLKKSLVTFFDESLRRLERPILSFDQSFDVVLDEDNVWVLRQKNFEAIFKESDAVLAKTTEWVEQLSSAVPLSEESKEYLAVRLRKTSVLRRKVTSLLRSPHLKTLTPEVIQSKLIAHGYDPGSVLDEHGHFILNPENEKSILLLLNEDLWTGDFSGEKYAATRKAKLS